MKSRTTVENEIAALKAVRRNRLLTREQEAYFFGAQQALLWMARKYPFRRPARCLHDQTTPRGRR